MSTFLAPSNSTAVNDVDPEYGARCTLHLTKRPRRDNAFTVTYCILAAATFIGGVATFIYSDKDLVRYSSAFYANSTTCNIEAFELAQELRPVSPVWTDTSDTFTARFMLGVSIWVPITLVCGVGFAVVYAILFLRAAIRMVWISIYASVALTLAVGIINFIAGAIPSGIILVVLAVIAGIMYWFMRQQLELCAKLLAISGKGLYENIDLVTASVLLKIVGLGIMIYMSAAFMCGIFVGNVGHNSQVVTRIGTDARGSCFDGQGFRVACCSWEVEVWAGVNCAVALFTFLWSVQLIMGIRLYIVAETISAWYFCPAGAPPDSPERPSVLRAVRHSLGPSFGSIAFASLIITLIEIVRDLLKRAARENIFCCIINCFAQPILALCEQFTRFATVACAITGLPFVGAAKNVFGTLKRNLLATYSVWYVPNLVLNMSVLLGSLTWAAVVYFAIYLQFKDDDDIVGLCFSVASVCFGLMAFILSFVAHLLLDIVNTVYVCYAMDLDARTVTHAEIHGIYSSLPGSQGAVVQNPDGGLAYGSVEPSYRPAQHYSGAAHPAYGGYQPQYPPPPGLYPGQQAPHNYSQAGDIQLQAQYSPAMFGK